jgi:hypothetical protein
MSYCLALVDLGTIAKSYLKTFEINGTKTEFLYGIFFVNKIMILRSLTTPGRFSRLTRRLRIITSRY